MEQQYGDTWVRQWPHGAESPDQSGPFSVGLLSESQTTFNFWWAIICSLSQQLSLSHTNTDHYAVNSWTSDLFHQTQVENSFSDSGYLGPIVPKGKSIVEIHYDSPPVEDTFIRWEPWCPAPHPLFQSPDLQMEEHIKELWLKITVSLPYVLNYFQKI